MKVNRETYPANTWLSQDSDVLFPRDQHPDTRTDREAIKAIEEKLGLKTTKSQWYPRRREQQETMMRPIICITTGQRFAGIRKAAMVLNVEASNICNNLKGRCPHVSGLVFRYE